MATTTPPRAPTTSRAPMDSLRKTAFWAGVLYLISFVSIPSLILYGPVKEAGYIAGPGPDTGVLFGGVLELIVGLAGIGTAVVLYKVLKRQNQAAALGLVGSRVLEGALIFAGVASILGVFFLITEVAAIAGKLLRTPVASDPAYILGAGSDMSIFLGSFFELLLVVAVIGTAVALYPLIKKQNESVALGYVFVRFLEAVLITVGAVSVLAVVTLRRGAEVAADAVDSGALATVNDALVAIFDWTFILGPNLFLGLNSALLAYLMYKSGLVPRLIARLGLAGGSLVVVSGTAMLFGVYELTSSWPFIMAAPVFAWEVSFALWLIVKGFKTSSSDVQGVELPVPDVVG